MAESIIKSSVLVLPCNNGLLRHRHPHPPLCVSVFSSAQAFPSLKFSTTTAPDPFFSSSTTDFYGRRLLFGDPRPNPNTNTRYLPSATSTNGQVSLLNSSLSLLFHFIIAFKWRKRKKKKNLLCFPLFGGIPNFSVF